MEMVEFNVRLGPQSEQSPQFREVHYSAKFATGDGNFIELRKSAQLYAPFLKESYSAAWLLSHIISEFMAEASAK
jgi:hypothetical protein